MSILSLMPLVFPLAILSQTPSPADALARLDRFDVVWDTPSQDASGSMPLGNGDIGLNVWVEQGGDLLFYIAKSDAWSENARLLKLGRVRVQLSPNPFLSLDRFAQTLQLQQGTIEIKATQGTQTVVLRLWVDAHAPVVHLEAAGNQPLELQVSLETWRTQQRPLEGEERHSAYGLNQSPEPVIVTPDTVLADQRDRVVWYHRNETSIWADGLRLQGMESWLEQGSDPLMHRTFGGLIQGDGMVSSAAQTLASQQPSQNHHVTICLHTSQTHNAPEWLDEIHSLATEVGASNTEEGWRAHEAWWRDFWTRSWIFVDGPGEAETVTRGYLLQRFMNACAGQGAYPIKFNGSLFTVDAELRGAKYDADFRQWGGPYWFQNTRLAYWPMLASGDFEMMLPLFRMFRENQSFAEQRTRVYFGHEGAFFPETMTFWGAYANDNYGWDRTGKPASHVDNQYIRYYWSGGLELIALMLGYYAHTQDADFLTATLIPLASSILTFYDEHYPRNDRGKLRIEPAQSLETWWDVINPMPPIAGLHHVLPRLLDLPNNQTPAATRARWERMVGELPGLPQTGAEGQERLAVAEEILGERRNQENPELYAIFPYRLFGVERPELDLARRTFEHRVFKGNRGWQQDDTQAALLGLTEQARQMAAHRFATKHEASRFPAFWGPNFDWIPDQDHGGNGLMALQTMLMQEVDGKLLLLPAWPADWDVAFRLHAPGGTLIEGIYRQQQIQSLSVVPESRRADVILMGGEQR